ncbi:MAG: hypothetical protein QG578_610 [Thermodesulfobacteriota bacterium]|nr:hypothetical protein [Thermodesulfobacteriota bacterium]
MIIMKRAYTASFPGSARNNVRSSIALFIMRGITSCRKSTAMRHKRPAAIAIRFSIKYGFIKLTDFTSYSKPGRIRTGKNFVFNYED